MPITNGNYTAPAWENGQAPAINDTELLAMSQTLQQAQILKGSGAPTQYTAATVGQIYRDESTQPHTLYQCTDSSNGIYVWTVSTNPNVNLAEEYSNSKTYTEGDYCIRYGWLYKAKQDINTAEEFNYAHWNNGHLLGNDLNQHIFDADNPHEVTKSQVGLGNVANERQYSAQNPPKAIGSITISTSWTGAASPYSQTVTVTGATVTANSKIDLQPTAAQISALISAGVTGLLVENNNGTLTVYALGAQTASSMTVQCTVEETE